MKNKLITIKDVLMTIGFVVVVLCVMGLICFGIYSFAHGVNDMLDSGSKAYSGWDANNLQPGQYVITEHTKGTVIKKHWSSQRYQIRQNDGTMTWIIKSEVKEQINPGE